MSGVDVLSVMDRARRTISAQSKLSDDVMAHLADDVIQARAAVAELIEAGKHVDAIVWLWRETGTPPHLGQLAQAADTLRAALARVQGEGA